LKYRHYTVTDSQQQQNDWASAVITNTVSDFQFNTSIHFFQKSNLLRSIWYDMGKVQQLSELNILDWIGKILHPHTNNN